MKNRPDLFVYWLQGFAELNPFTVPSPDQWRIIKDHLNLVFDKVTPNRIESPVAKIEPTYCGATPLEKINQSELLERIGKTFDNPNWNGKFPPKETDPRVGPLIC